MGHELNKNKTSFLDIVALLKFKRTRFHSNLSPIEGKTFKKEDPQEERMDTSSKKVLMQKILECVETQVEVLKKIISHLSKIEEDNANYGQSKLTQEDNDHMMTEGKVHLLLPNFMPQLKSTLGPWTFKRAHVNDFSKSGDAGSWEVYDWPEWTSKEGTTQATLAHFMLERNMDPSFDDDQYLVMNQNEEAEEEDD